MKTWDNTIRRVLREMDAEHLEDRVRRVLSGGSRGVDPEAEAVAAVVRQVHRDTSRYADTTVETDVGVFRITADSRDPDVCQVTFDGAEGYDSWEVWMQPEEVAEMAGAFKSALGAMRVPRRRR